MRLSEDQIDEAFSRVWSRPEYRWTQQTLLKAELSWLHDRFRKTIRKTHRELCASTTPT